MLEYMQDLIGEKHNNEEVFYAINDYVVDKETEEGFEGLTEEEKKSFLIGLLLMEVNNGGFDQYFLNTEGVYARDTVEFLDLIGERKFAKLLDEAVSIFRAVIPDDRKMEEFQKLDDRFYELNLEDYEVLYDNYVGYLKQRVR